MKYKFLSHTADLKIRIYGKDLSEIIKNSLLALKEFLKPTVVAKKIEKDIEIEGNGVELLINFLSEVLTNIYIHKTIFIDFIGTIENNQLKGKIIGFKFSNIKKEIKAITYHQAKLEKKRKQLIFEFIVDI